MYRYDKRYTLFVYQIYKKVITKPTTTQTQSPASTTRQFEYFLCRATEQKMYREQYKKTNLLKIASKEVTFYKYFKVLVFY